jgi:hypothetical protein
MTHHNNISVIYYTVVYIVENSMEWTMNNISFKFIKLN